MATPSVRDAVLGDYARNLIQRKARQLARQRGFARHEAEGLESRLRIALLEALAEYDARRGHINPFIKTVVKNAAAIIVREQLRLKRGGGQQPVSLDAPVATSPDSETTLGELLTPLDAGRRLGLVPDAPDQDDEVAAVVDSLAPGLREVALGLMHRSESAQAKELGVSRPRLGYAVDEIRRRFQLAGFGEPEE
ncbi:MAG: hypothetical protein HOP29_14240 [Phycisphaerales bacterium]|nr:hypothetical protein [Phycisphaerales bacterium]